MHYKDAIGGPLKAECLHCSGAWSSFESTVPRYCSWCWKPLWKQSITHCKCCWGPFKSKVLYTWQLLLKAPLTAEYIRITVTSGDPFESRQPTCTLELLLEALSKADYLHKKPCFLRCFRDPIRVPKILFRWIK